MSGFDYDKYKEEAVKNKMIGIKLNAKKKKKSNVQKTSLPNKTEHRIRNAKSGSVGSGSPYLRNTFGWNRYDIRELEETARVAPVARSMWQLELVAFPYFEFKIVSPRGITVNEKDEERLLPKLESIDRKINTVLCCKQTMRDVMTYGSAFFEVVWGEDDEGWLIPKMLVRLPAESFKKAPNHASGNTQRYQCGHLLKGVVLDKKDGSMHYYQLQDESTGTPVEIPFTNIIHIKDSNSSFVDGEPYLAGIVSTISQLEFTRKKLMQTVSRVGTPPTITTVRVPPEYLEASGGLTGALPGEGDDGSTLADAMFSQLWGYGVSVSEGFSSDMSVTVPYGVDISGMKIGVPFNPEEVDQYLIREAVSHIFPRDVLEVLSTSMSTTAPLLELLKIMVQGWQQICSIPFENRLWTKFLVVNGFKSYRIELEWAPLIPEDPKIVEKETLEKSLQLFDRHVITLEECRQAIGLDVDKMDELKKILYEEMLAYKVPQSLMQQQQEVGNDMGVLGALGMSGEGGGTETGTEESMNEGSEYDNTVSSAEELLAQLEAEGYNES